jgi:hypothetical protein
LFVKPRIYMEAEEIENYILEHFININPLDTWGERSFFVNPENKLKRGTYFATIKNKDGKNDSASNLDRKNIYRLNIGISREKYLSLFEIIPKRPSKAMVITGDYNFQQVNEILPHPVYGWMNWVSILNPDKTTFEHCKSLLEDAYIKALKTATDKLRQSKAHNN